MNCIYYLAGYCQLQREHFCEYNNQERCPKFLVDNSPENKTECISLTAKGVRKADKPLDTYNSLEEQLKWKEWATGKLSDVQGIKIIRRKQDEVK